MNNENYDWFAAQLSATDDTETELAPRDNEAYRRDFTVLDVQKFGGESKTLTISAPNTLGQLLHDNLDLDEPVAEDASVRVYERRNSRRTLIIVDSQA